MKTNTPSQRETLPKSGPAVSVSLPHVDVNCKEVNSNFSPHNSKDYFNTMAFVGKYERTKAENYDEFLSALGVNFLLRKAATVSTPIMEVSQSLQMANTSSLKLFKVFDFSMTT